MSLLENLSGPADLRRLDDLQLRQLCRELRGTMISTVASTGGHLGSSLGVVELSVALHRLLDSPTDKLVWDTGHQAYAHKLLTGRLPDFGSLRQLGGVGGFPRRSESEHDVFDGGHAGTGLSIAEGLAIARDQRGSRERVVVVVGDAALISGMALEALNDIGHRGTRLLIVLNDNEMSISPTVGALSQYLSRIKLSRTWRGSKRIYDDLVERLPVVGPAALEWSRRLRKSVVNFAQPGQLFEDLGITYVGPVPGHNLRALEAVLRRALRDLDGPVIVHVRTEKGRGYQPAVADKVSFHGAALPPMTVVPGGQSGAPSQAAVERGDGDATPSMAQAVAARSKPPTYTQVMAQELISLGRADPRIVAITAGMPTGTGLSKFQAVFPDRMYDVGISEQHAVTLATGLALGGLRPYVALYSTFLQRAFDQTVHDVCQNDQPVVIGVDRAGLVGEDGTSHQGMFALPAQRQLPNLVIASPKDEQELRRLMHTAFGQQHPFALHYPRDPGFDLPAAEPTPIPVGEAELLREGSDVLIVAFGPIVMRGLEAAEQLAAEGWSVALVNARFVKPLDRRLIVEHARGKRLVATLEESVVAGGFGSAVLEALNEAALSDAALRQVPLRILGLPADRFVDHGSVTDLRRVLRLDTAGIVEQLREPIAALSLAPSAAPARPRRKRSA
jgi:1-deoxy-D-xylulose-5-phosphate synthase